MTNKIIIRGALANTNGQLTSEDLVGFLGERTSDSMAIYVFRPDRRNIMASALDWQAILGATADIIAVGGALWAAYERFIKPIREKALDSRSFLHIVVQHPNGRSMQFSLGTQILDKNEFIQLFNETVTAMQSEPASDCSVFEEVEDSDVWTKI